MEEFTHTLLENGSIEKKEDQFTLKGSPEDIKVPDTIQGIIAARMDRLEDNLKRTMQVASVIGLNFAFKILQTITGMRSELKSYLLNLQGLEFIYEKNLFPELEYIFKHALTQEVAYNSLLQKRKKELHEKIGMAIEKLYPERLEEFYEMLAYHFYKSENLDQAIHYSKLSAKKAKKNFSHWETYNFYKDAYDLFCKKDDNEKNKEDRIYTLVLASNPLLLLGMPDESLWVIDKQIELAEELGDSNRVSMYYSHKANYYTHRGDMNMAGQYAEKAFKKAEKSQNLDLMVQNSHSAAMPYTFLGEYHKVLSIVPKVVRLIEEHKRESDSFLSPFKPYPFLLLYCGSASGSLGLFRDGIEYFNKGIKHALESSDKFALAGLELSYGFLFSIKGEWELAIKHFKEGIKYSQEINLWMEVPGYCLMGHATVMLKDYDRGVEYLNKGLKMHENSDVELLMPISYLRAALVYKELGNFNLAKEYAEKSLNLSIKNNEKNTKALCKVILGYLSGKIDSDQKTQSLDLLEKGIKDLENFKMGPSLAFGYLSKAELYQDSKESVKAIENLKIAETMFQEMEMDFWLNRTQNMLAELE
jgi:tetratricopeptide (TPR) repeat protein